MKLTVLMPVFNELPRLPEVFDRVVSQWNTSPLGGNQVTKLELICIDDASNDGSRAWLRDLLTTFHDRYACKIPIEYRLLEQEQNHGKGAAITRGIEASRGDIILIQDADLEYFPQDYDALLKPLLAGEADAVYGSRFLPHPSRESVRWLSFIQKFANLFLTWLFNFVSATCVTDVETCYKVLRGPLARGLRLNARRFGIELELTARLSRVHARIREVPIRYEPRTFAEGKKISAVDGLAAIFHILRYNVFDTQPFRSGLRGEALKSEFTLRPRRRTLSLTIFALALGLRLAFVADWFKTPYAFSPLLDALSYDRWARSILDGHIFRETAFYQSPLYPYVLAGIYKIFGAAAGWDFLIVSILQAFLGALTCVFLARLALRYFGEGAGLLTGLLAAFYRPLLFYTAPVMKETLTVFLMALFLVVFASALDSWKKRSFLFTGLTLGLTALTRGNALILTPFVIATIFSHAREGSRRSRVFRSVIFTLALAAAIAPATLHNWVVSRDFVPLNFTSGFNFYMGSSSSTTGASAYPPGISSEPLQEERDVTRVAEQALGRKLKPSEVSSYWFDQGLTYIRSHPWNQLASVLNKTLFLLNDFEQPDNYDIHFLIDEMPTLLRGPWIGFGLLLLLSVVGFSLTPKNHSPRWMAVMGVVYGSTLLVYYVTDRYRLPLVVFLFPFAGAAVPALTHFGRNPLRLGLTATAAVLTAAFAYFPLHVDQGAQFAFDWGVIATVYSDRGDDAKAVEAFKRGEALRLSALTTDAFVKTSTSLERLGREREAENLLLRARDLRPDDGLAHFNLGRFKYERGDLPAAEISFQAAAQRMPWSHLPYLGLALVKWRVGQKSAALTLTQTGLKLDPQSPQLKQILGLLTRREPASTP